MYTWSWNRAHATEIYFTGKPKTIIIACIPRTDVRVIFITYSGYLLDTRQPEHEAGHIS
jgi:hypothetical protein